MNDWNEKRLKLLESMKRFAAEKAEKETELKKQKETLKKLYQLKETQKKSVKSTVWWHISGKLPRGKKRALIWNGSFWGRFLML